MITKADLKKAKTLTELHDLLDRFKVEASPDINRKKEINDEIKALRVELRQLNKSIGKNITEEDILLKLGETYASTM